jgi:hypothetical protein
LFFPGKRIEEKEDFLPSPFNDGRETEVTVFEFTFNEDFRLVEAGIHLTTFG